MQEKINAANTAAGKEGKQLSCNPLAMHAVFDALAGGGSSITCPPSAMFELVPKWKVEGTESFLADLGSAQSKKLGAFSFFAFLIFIVLDLIVESGVNGWFPDQYWG